MNEEIKRLNQDVAELLADILAKRAIEDRKRRKQANADYDREMTRRMLEAAKEPPVYVLS